MVRDLGPLNVSEPIGRAFVYSQGGSAAELGIGRRNRRSNSHRGLDSSDTIYTELLLPRLPSELLYSQSHI